MAPDAVERWRILNGSVDGTGYKRFMVLKGQYAMKPVHFSLCFIDPNPNPGQVFPGYAVDGPPDLAKISNDPAS